LCDAQFITWIIASIGALGSILTTIYLYKSYTREKRREHSKKLKEDLKKWLSYIASFLSKIKSLSINPLQEIQIDFLKEHIKSKYKEMWNLWDEIEEKTKILSNEYDEFIENTRKSFKELADKSNLPMEIYFINNIILILKKISIENMLEFEIREEKQGYVLTEKKFPGNHLFESENQNDCIIGQSIIAQLINSEENKEKSQKIFMYINNICQKLNKFMEYLSEKINLIEYGGILKGKCNLGY